MLVGGDGMQLSMTTAPVGSGSDGLKASDRFFAELQIADTAPF